MTPPADGTPATQVGGPLFLGEGQLEAFVPAATHRGLAILRIGRGEDFREPMLGFARPGLSQTGRFVALFRDIGYDGNTLTRHLILYDLAQAKFVEIQLRPDGTPSDGDRVDFRGFGFVPRLVEIPSPEPDRRRFAVFFISSDSSIFNRQGPRPYQFTVTVDQEFDNILEHGAVDLSRQFVSQDLRPEGVTRSLFVDSTMETIAIDDWQSRWLVRHLPTDSEWAHDGDGSNVVGATCGARTCVISNRRMFIRSKLGTLLGRQVMEVLVGTNSMDHDGNLFGMSSGRREELQLVMQRPRSDCEAPNEVCYGPLEPVGPRPARLGSEFVAPLVSPGGVVAGTVDPNDVAEVRIWTDVEHAPIILDDLGEFFEPTPGLTSGVVATSISADGRCVGLEAHRAMRLFDSQELLQARPKDVEVLIVCRRA